METWRSTCSFTHCFANSSTCLAPRTFIPKATSYLHTFHQQELYSLRSQHYNVSLICPSYLSAKLVVAATLTTMSTSSHNFSLMLESRMPKFCWTISPATGNSLLETNEWKPSPCLSFTTLNSSFPII